MNDTITIDGITYKRIAEPTNMVVVRTVAAGVHAGELARREGKEITLRNARRIWRWRGANTLHEVATKGVDSASSSGYTRVSEPVEEITLLDAIEIVPGHQSACFSGERQEKRGLK